MIQLQITKLNFLGKQAFPSNTLYLPELHVVYADISDLPGNLKSL